MRTIGKTLLGMVRQWPVAIAALVVASIIHICTTYIMPGVYRADAYSRLARTLPFNSMVILPAAKPNSQVLPFQLPDARYAICLFDVAKGPIEVSAVLPEPGWTLTVYSASGESFYSSPAPRQRRLNVGLTILPPGNRYLGPITPSNALPITKRLPVSAPTQLKSPTARGLIIIRAPNRGRAFADQSRDDIGKAACRQLTPLKT